jgi:Holliday junction resolvase RusA-like endonuclease
MPESITITLPLPGRVLSPNYRPASRGGAIGRAIAAKRYKALAAEAVNAQRLETIPWPAASLAIVFVHPAKRRRDADNALASLKSAIDGIVMAGLVADDSAEHITIESVNFTAGQPARVEIKAVRRESK